MPDDPRFVAGLGDYHNEARPAAGRLYGRPVWIAGIFFLLEPAAPRCSQAAIAVDTLSIVYFYCRRAYVSIDLAVVTLTATQLAGGKCSEQFTICRYSLHHAAMEIKKLYCDVPRRYGAEPANEPG
jgi:hypothetical protein